MRTRKILRPGQNGTKNLQQEYGEQLVCVRYRDDTQRGVRHKTVELIVETIPLEIPRQATAPEIIVGLKVAWQEAAVQKIVRQAGGRWNRECRYWELPYALAKRLGLEPGIDPATLPSNKITRPAGENPGQGHGYRQA